MQTLDARVSRALTRLLGTLTGTTPLDLPGRGAQALRDLRSLEQRLVHGRGPSPLLPRGPRREKTQAVQPRRHRVREVVRETADAVSIYFEPLDGAPLAHFAGQFMTVELTVGAERLRRAYSLASCPRDAARPYITVKRVEGGRVSNALVDGADALRELALLGPSGHFTVEDAPVAPARLVFIAGGSGITPIMGLLSDALATEPDRPITLLYGNRAEADIIFAARLDALRDAHPSTLRIEHVLEAPSPRAAAVGRLERATIDARLDALGHDDTPDTLYFVCGPAPMMDAASEALLARGVEERRIRVESFGRPGEQAEARGLEAPAALTVRFGGRSLVGEALPGETLLEAGLRLGAPMPFSCAMGGCGACRVRLADGQAQMDTPNCLSADERAEGYVLACVGRPGSACTVEVG